LAWPVSFAVGLVLLIYIHEAGHFLVARRLGLNVGLPVFVPFIGAYVALKNAPRNAWLEAQVAMAGPRLGAIAAGACVVIYFGTGRGLFEQLAYYGFLMNMLNLLPIAILDGAKVIVALSPRLVVLGTALLGAFLLVHWEVTVMIL